MTIFSGFYALRKKVYTKAVSGYIPSALTVPLNQRDGECTSIVQPGDKVEEGQLIAVSSKNTNGISASIYSPVPGTVEAIEKCFCPDGSSCEGIKIKLGGRFRFLGKKLQECNTDTLTQESILEKIYEKGILNTFITDKPFSLAEQLKEAGVKNSKKLIVRLFDEDSLRLTDTLITSIFSDEVFEGAKITAKAMNAEEIIFAGDTNLKDKIENLDFGFPISFFKIDSKYYPSGYKTELIKAIKKDEKEIISKTDIFTDSSTMFEVYRSLKFDKPVIDRYIHISGDCIPASGLVKVAIGTTFASLAQQCGGFLKSPAAVIVNGLLTGNCTQALNTPVTKYVKSINFIHTKQCRSQEKTVCIRCGNCRRICPQKLSPDIIYRHITGCITAEKEYLESADLCIECGLCNSVCPSRIPICQTLENFKRQNKKNIHKEESAALPSSSGTCCTENILLPDSALVSTQSGIEQTSLQE